MVEDKKISESAELLLKGAKMLRYHCPHCNMPLFKYNEKIICPSCKTEFQIQDGKVIKASEGMEIKREVEIVDEPKYSIKSYLTKLIEKMCKRALDCESLSEIKEIVSIIENLTEILEKVNNL